jgi:hypothetical protein
LPAIADGVALPGAGLVAVRVQLACTRAKEDGRRCEDVILGCRAHGRYAVSDGASVSFDSRGWARALCGQFLRDGNVGPGWLQDARDRFAAASAAPAEDWAAAHAADRGSFATFLGLAITDRHIAVHAIGDTILFVVTPDGQVGMVPEMTADEFRRDPVLLCSRAGRGAFADTEAAFAAAEVRLAPPAGGWQGTRLLAMTDAVAQWVAGAADADGRRRRLDELTGQTSRAGFRDWAGERIAAGEVRRDDCALLTIRL